MSLAAPVPRSWLRWFAVWKWPFERGGYVRMAMLALVIGFLSLFSYGLLYRQTLRLGMCMHVDPVAMTQISFAEPGYGIEFYLPMSLRDYVPIFFEPAHRIDQWLRPDLWGKTTTPLAPEEMNELFSDLTPEEFEELPLEVKQRLESLAPSENSH